ncbi:DUF1684 domain-containing protein [Streptomyces naganishii]|uniref:DUF1684 domain-containing protein n=1 Tax=Streptomyces naganishii JCM 4654 TaxID=1306179 RepID=A0A918Y920_9ACTN|nr:DUF1684 domain-containing protein [Streptomyces naganishii]GHD95384.1 hypothetical protein GCM10010508_59930 [Streptomyces naganishii JCM 4654]
MTDASDQWKQWHERRTETVPAPCGPLALTGTHWLADYPDGRIPDIPGSWAADGGAVVLTAAATDGPTVDGRPVAGRVRLEPDTGPVASPRVALGERRLVVLVREGAWGVRDYDPGAPARRTFRGVAATAYDPDRAVPGRFAPYRESRTVRVPNAAGRGRGPALDGEPACELGGERRTLREARRPDGSLWAVSADATSEDGGFRFRFRYAGAPDVEGLTAVDLNRAQLPPCAFAGHFARPFPPPGNTLGLAIPAGERTLL